MFSRKYVSGAENENDAKSNITIHSSFDSNTIIENLKTEIQVNNLDENSLNDHETELKLAANNSVSINNVLLYYLLIKLKYQKILDFGLKLLIHILEKNVLLLAIRYMKKKLLTMQILMIRQS